MKCIELHKEQAEVASTMISSPYVEAGANN